MIDFGSQLRYETLTAFSIIIYQYSNITYPPFRLGGKLLRLVVGGGGGDDLVAVLVDRPRRRRRQLTLLLRLLLDLGDLLPLSARRADLHAQNDVPDLGLRQTRHVHVVLLAVVGQDQIFEGHLNLKIIVDYFIAMQKCLKLF